MLRLLIRFIGICSLAGAFAALIVDGARSIAANALSLTRLSDVLAKWSPALKEAATRVNPLLWDPALLAALRAPLVVALAIAGLLLMWAARKRQPPIGVSSRA